jgi:hypothetical protein
MQYCRQSGAESVIGRGEIVAFSSGVREVVVSGFRYDVYGERKIF